jgi:hypothetical protein
MIDRDATRVGPAYTLVVINEFEFCPTATSAEIVYVPRLTLEVMMDADVIP